MSERKAVRESDMVTEPRTAMKPTGAASGYVDGGWWPRSTDPASEFPGLIGALHEYVGQVSRVVYNLDFWESAHRNLVVDGRVVRCEGFRTMNAHTVTVIGADSRRVTVLVVPPDTPVDNALAVLRTASGQDSTASVEDILASNGARSDRPTTNPISPSQAQAADSIPDQRWEDEGGKVHKDNQVPTNSGRQPARR
jgi:Family of unknown function (DUF5994)